MHTSQWARHSRAIEDAREQQDTRLVGKAIHYAMARNGPTAAAIASAQTGCFIGEKSAGEALRNAIEIALEEYLTDFSEEDVA